MLKRTITLLGLTITVGALLLTFGCGGSNSNPVAPVSSDQLMLAKLGIDTNNPSRARGNGSISVVSSSPAKAVISDPDGIASVVLLWWFGGANWKYEFYRGGGAQTIEIPLRYFGQAECAVALTDANGATDSVWKITRDGNYIRLFP